MKLISFVVPSFNSEAYLHHAVDTILSGGEEVEIIIVNDGSADGTAAIADDYAARYPDIVKAVHKPNGGHGSGVNRGLQEASGLFYKVVDSDDWVNEEALRTLLDTLRTHIAQGCEADLYFTNFIYDHTLDGTRFVRDWNRQFPANKFFTWDEAGIFVGPQVLLMHSLLYKTEVLRASGTVLPEHTFYVDNYFAYRALPYCKSLYYLDVNLYHYFIGREDQSVNINNFKKRYDQQIRVMECMLYSYSYDEICALPKGLSRYMFHCLSAIMMNTTMFCSVGKEPERKLAFKNMWETLKQRDPKLYRQLRYKSMPAAVSWMPWDMRTVCMAIGYKIVCKFVKLG